MTTSRKALTEYLDTLLQPNQFDDYMPNGLQVEGKKNIDTLISGVTASQALIEQAITKKADAILVHHGYFWRGEDPMIVGIKHHRLKALLQHDINLFAYHLPLDAHPVYGNSVQLAKLLGIKITGNIADRGLDYFFYGTLAEPLSAEALSTLVNKKLNRQPLCIPGKSKNIESIAWCTGAAQKFIQVAVNLEVDAYLTGEVSESTVHVARETGLHFFAAGHHATERYGAKALGEHLASKFGLQHEFVDIDNPV